VCCEGPGLVNTTVNTEFDSAMGGRTERIVTAVSPSESSVEKINTKSTDVICDAVKDVSYDYHGTLD
jgi:hypothetical protein